MRYRAYAYIGDMPYKVADLFPCRLSWSGDVAAPSDAALGLLAGRRDAFKEARDTGQRVYVLVQPEEGLDGCHVPPSAHVFEFTVKQREWRDYQRSDPARPVMHWGSLAGSSATHLYINGALSRFSVVRTTGRRYAVVDAESPGRPAAECKSQLAAQVNAEHRAIEALGL